MPEQFCETIANTTAINHDTIAEAAKAMRFSNIKKLIILVVIYVILSILLFLWNATYSGFFLLGGTIVVIVLYFARSGKRAKKIASILIAQIKTNYHKDEFSCDMMIDDKKIHIKTPNTEKDLFHTDIKKIYDTKTLFVLIYNGNICTIVDKNGFSEGDSGQFLRLIGQKHLISL